MSGQSGRMPDDDPDDSELVTRVGDLWRAKGCRGCGEGPDDLARIDAIATAASLQRRFALLLASPERSLRYRGPVRGSWSAMEPAVRVSDVLAAADRRLRTLLDEDMLDPVPRARGEQAIDLLAEAVRRLTGTIAGSTTEDWRRRESKGGATAGELVWLALHEATHHLEDAELLLDSATNGDPPEPGAPALHSVPNCESQSDS